MLPGLLRIARDIEALQAFVEPIVESGANASTNLEMLVVPKVNRVLVPVNKSWMAIGAVQHQMNTVIAKTRASIFQQGKEYAAAGGNLAKQNAAIDEAMKLYSKLDTETKVIVDKLKGLQGLQDLVKDFNVVGIIKKVEKALQTASRLYVAIQGFYKNIGNFANFLGKPLPVVNWPDLQLDNITTGLAKVNQRIEGFLEDIVKLASAITGTIPDGPFAGAAVRTRIEDIARNLKSNSTAGSPEMANTVAFGEFHKNNQKARHTLAMGAYKLGNISIELSAIKNTTITGRQLLNEVTVFLKANHYLPGLMFRLVYGQIVFCLVVAIWVKLYVLQWHVLRKPSTMDSVAKALYAVFHVLLQGFMMYCVVVLCCVVVGGVAYTGLTTGICEETYKTAKKYTPLCQEYIYPTDAALPGTMKAAGLTVFFALNMVATYHAMAMNHMENENVSKPDQSLTSDSESGFDAAE